MKAVDEKIGRFIGNSDTVFIIPPFQRNYSWDEEQCEELFDDILDSIEKKKSHYIGNIVYYVGENDRASFSEYILIDGQQRITSILLLLCAIKYKLPKVESKKLAKKFLLNEDEEDAKFRVKLKQTEDDSKIFEKIVNIEPRNDDSDNEPNNVIDDDSSSDNCSEQFTAEEKESRLYKNYHYFLDRLSDLSADMLLKFYDAVADLDIVDLNLKIENDLEAVQKIFEKINSTGKELSIADLIRNYLLISNRSDVQKELYDKYWVKIEGLYKDKEKISDFAKHYLITKRGIWAEEKKVYNTFKLYFNNSEMSKEEILSEFLEYSKYYNWLADEKSPDDKINTIIKQLNVLKSDDMYSLLLVLFDKMYDTDKAELQKILELLADFMLRYRIVAPVNGSGDIRKTLFTILTKITRGDIAITYNEILHELSNSPSPGGRFPDDKEFKAALSRYVNTTYAKALLYKLEYKEVKNIEVDIRKVTVEHLMPQTLSEKWKEYLGGEERALMIHNTYINNIGNLALLSRPLNSENSNDIWDNKKKNIKASQFVLTNSIDDTVKWNDQAITSRCEYLTGLALEHITGPLPRDRDFESVEVTEDFVSGVYNLKDINFRVTGRSIKSVVFEGRPYSVRGWFELVALTCKLLYEKDDKKFDEIVNQNRIHKSSFSQSYYLGNDPIICREERYLVSPLFVEETGYYVESTLSAERAIHYTTELASEYELLDRFMVEIA